MSKHGHAGTGRRSAEYMVWNGMVQRCNQPSTTGFKNYGGRGIKVCERWLQFENFLADMGARPSDDHSIDRIDANGNYEPSNCRWATRVEQARNRRSSRMITAFGRTQCATAWAEELGLVAGSLRSRLYRGWSAERAILEPAGLERSPGAARERAARLAR